MVEFKATDDNNVIISCKTQIQLIVHYYSHHRLIAIYECFTLVFRIITIVNFKWISKFHKIRKICIFVFVCIYKER